MSLWNWQHPKWPHFQWQADAMAPREVQLLQEAGLLFGAFQHLDAEDQAQLTIELVSTEAIETSAIEGELLDRASVQSSLKKHFGLAPRPNRAKPAEQGIAEMMADLYQHYAAPLSHETLLGWHQSLMLGRQDLHRPGGYRDDAMEIVSGTLNRTRVHYEAPPADRVPDEMAGFITWFNRTAPQGAEPLPLLTRAGLAHLYFESIHPFEDGNGRIGRAISEKALAQGLGRPTLIVLSQTIERRKKEYYQVLEQVNHTLEVTDWLRWFGDVILEAERNSRTWVHFLVAKARVFRQLAGQLNDRQEKALARIFREGPPSLGGGFKGGLSAKNYATITGAPPATTTRDLHHLTTLGILTRTGERRHTRYWLNLTPFGFIDPTA